MAAAVAGSQGSACAVAFLACALARRRAVCVRERPAKTESRAGQLEDEQGMRSALMCVWVSMFEVLAPGK